MDLSNLNGYSLTDLGQINVILGKNGAGKSYLLTQLDQQLRRDKAYGLVRYITPERGGSFIHEASIAQNISQNATWMEDVRRRNQYEQFRQQSAVLFQRLETIFLRQIEKDQYTSGYLPRTFDDVVSRLNTLLDRIRIQRDNKKTFNLMSIDSNEPVNADQISSGESELLSLGVECMAFAAECPPDKQSVLLIDEPDVHLHPDLQDRFAQFLVQELAKPNIITIIATHSTALLAGLAERKSISVAFMRRKQTTFKFKPVNDVDRAVLPMFGAHPLSNFFAKTPILLLEGDDDERMWQQAVRSAEGRIRVYPCVVDGKSQLSSFETETNAIIGAVYDAAKAYSLRDRDDAAEEINDLEHVVRMRLGCRAAENLFLTDEVLGRAGTDWPTLQNAITGWLQSSASHKYHLEMKAFSDAGFPRKTWDLKDIRNILVGLISNRPWESLVGQSIAALAVNGGESNEGSIRSFLGTKVCQHILKLPVT